MHVAADCRLVRVRTLAAASAISAGHQGGASRVDPANPDRWPGLGRGCGRTFHNYWRGLTKCMSHLYTLCRAALRKTAGPNFELLIVKVTERLKLAAMLQCLQETVIFRIAGSC